MGEVGPGPETAYVRYCADFGRPRHAGQCQSHLFLYLSSLVLGITGLIGLVIAYLGKGKGDPVIESHYANQINIFWKMLAFCVVGLLLTFILIGVLILLAALVWYIVRIVQGMQALSAGSPVENPGSWLF